MVKNIEATEITGGENVKKACRLLEVNFCFEKHIQAFARWRPDIVFDIAAQPILENRWIDSYSQPSLQTQFIKLQWTIRFTPSHCLDVRQDWYPMYYPGGMKARVSPVQSIEPHRILEPTRDTNQEPPAPQSKGVTTILPLHGQTCWLFVEGCSWGWKVVDACINHLFCCVLLCTNMFKISFPVECSWIE